jgi:NADPH-dependent 2,4-dienoyl-CoA reductase/sulfur reductase-like enzyme
LLLDEQPAPGGQIYRAVTETPMRERGILGADYWRGGELVEAARRAPIDWRQGATVWNVSPEREIGISRGGVTELARAKRVILATGALERPFPVPGWTLPGVMTVGAAQILLKSSGAVAAGRVVIAGTGPLPWLLAAQYLRAGAGIAAILDTTPRENLRRALPHLPAFLISDYFRKGLALLREVRRRVPVVVGVRALRAEGEGALARVVYRAGGGAEVSLGAETLLLHQGVVPNVNLALAAGVAHEWNERQLCFQPVLDPDFGSSMPGIAVAGDGAGIAGGMAAPERGRLAAIATVRALKPDAAVPDPQPVRRRLQRQEMGRAFLDRLNQPAVSFRQPADDILVCRCEEVTARQVRDMAKLGCEGPNQMKAFLRCGMGPCQGRLCGLTVTELIATERQTTPAAVGYYRLRPPVKPITLAELASLPISEAERKAVER